MHKRNRSRCLCRVCVASLWNRKKCEDIYRKTMWRADSLATTFFLSQLWHCSLSMWTCPSGRFFVNGKQLMKCFARNLQMMFVQVVHNILVVVACVACNTWHPPLCIECSLDYGYMCIMFLVCSWCIVQKMRALVHCSSCKNFQMAGKKHSLPLAVLAPA